MTDAPALSLVGAAKRYGATVALEHGDLELAAGEVHVLIGSNGSGKSTLCRIVAGSIAPDAGELRVRGRPVGVAGPRASRNLGIGVFYQELSLAANRTVAENVALGALVDGGAFVDRRAVARAAAAAIEPFADVAGEGFSADAIVATLRPDQRQLVEIMKAFAGDPGILIFDEPTSALDRAQVLRFFERLRAARADGRAVVFISHRMDEIFEIGDRVTVIREGRTVATMPVAGTTPEAVVAAMTGEDAVAPGGPPAAGAGSPRDGAFAAGAPPLLECTALAGAGVKGVDLVVRPGEIAGLGGLHGQGQSTLLRLLFGLERVAGGTATLGGGPHAPRSPRDAIRRGCAYVSGDRGRTGTITGRSIAENVVPVHALPARRALALPGRTARAIVPALASLGTKYASLDASVGSLSGGNQQKAVIARWLVERPRLLLLDDPTKGIDLAAKRDLFVLLRRLAADGTAVLLYSSEDSELLDNADRVVVFSAGRVVAELAGASLTRYALYEAAYGRAGAGGRVA